MNSRRTLHGNLIYSFTEFNILRKKFQYFSTVKPHVHSAAMCTEPAERLWFCIAYCTIEAILLDMA